MILSTQHYCAHAQTNATMQVSVFFRVAGKFILPYAGGGAAGGLGLRKSTVFYMDLPAL